MVFSYEDKIRKRIYQGIVLAGLISAPFTKGVGLVATFGGLMASRKYNTVLQTPEERFEEKHYELINSINNDKKNLEQIAKGTESAIEFMNSNKDLDINEIAVGVKNKYFLGKNLGRNFYVEVK